MAQVTLRSDMLDREATRFEPMALGQPLFLNSIPKSGSHLLRNILRMFIPLDQQYDRQFIQWPNLAQHLAAFDPRRNYMSFGHLFFGDMAAIHLTAVRKILLVRDPYDWVLARARFYLSDEFSDNLDQLKDPRLPIEDLLSIMIFGMGTKVPSLRDMYELNVVGWLASSVHVVRYEQLVFHANNLASAESKAYFTTLLSACGIDRLPDDWADRVTTGSDRRQSATARENLTGAHGRVPDVLSSGHRLSVDYAAPQLRSLLGYHEVNP